MTEAYEVFVPLLNPNEPDANVAAIHVSEGAWVSKGDALCTLETTKSIADVLAEHDGYVKDFHVEVGSIVSANCRLCWLTASSEWKPPSETLEPQVQREPLPGSIRITAPARKLAQEMGIDVASLPTDLLITEDTLRKMASSRDLDALSIPDGPFHPRSLLIYGGGGHAKSLIDLIRVLGDHDIAGIVDDGMEPGREVMGIAVLGGGQILNQLFSRGIRTAVNAVGGVGDIMSRVRVFRRIQDSGLACPTLIHPSAVIEPSADLNNGVQVFPHAYIGSEAKIGYGVIINTGAVVSHDCVLGAYTNVAPGALLAGGVILGEAVLVGMGATINLGVEVGAGSRVGNSAVIKDDVPAGTIVRAGSIWPTPE
jgi:sugar O-acyltransferase (sialic acid O-acetyltransferase NeuD family)